MSDVERLPRGRHGLSREEVAKVQRDRIILAMISLVAEHGFSGASVSLLTREARVSRETFYEHFDNKHDCFLAAYETTADDLRARIVESQLALPPDTGDLERVDAAVQCYLDLIAENPAIGQAFLVQVFAAGPAAIARLLEFRAMFVNAAMAIRGRTSDEDRFVCEAYLGAMITMATRLTCEGNADQVSTLGPPLRELARRILIAEVALEDLDQSAVPD